MANVSNMACAIILTHVSAHWHQLPVEVKCAARDLIFLSIELIGFSVHLMLFNANSFVLHFDLVSFTEIV